MKKLGVEEQKVPNSELLIVEPKVKLNLGQDDAKLRKVNNPWTPEVSFIF